MPCHEERDVHQLARAAAQRSDRRLVLAVSGGLDSMSLLDAMSAVAPERIAAVATFDHASGTHSAQAVAHVVSESRRLGLRVLTARLTDRERRAGGQEATWREARHRFLRDAAASLGAQVVTAHTRDDQIETVLMRAMRGAGARGLAGLAAPSPMLRPFLEARRVVLERYARSRSVSWLEDPSNTNLVFLRNRVRHEILPAMRAVDASIDEALWTVGQRAARWRTEMEVIVDARIAHRTRPDGALLVAASELAGYDASSLGEIWGVLAGRIGLALDRRGTHRCATFTMKRPRAGAIQISGGWRLEALRGELMLSRASASIENEVELPDAGTVTWGEFRFSVAEGSDADDRWVAEVTGGGPLMVRRWRAGDRLAPAQGQGPRRVTRYLADARLVGSERVGWPVVLQGEEIVWIPGVRRSDAATARSGRPARRYLCERAHS
jgi:tRNA(Ile)-lysidine synthase